MLKACSYSGPYFGRASLTTALAVAALAIPTTSAAHGGEWLAPIVAALAGAIGIVAGILSTAACWPPLRSFLALFVVCIVAATIAILPSGGVQGFLDAAALLTLLSFLPFAGGFAIGVILVKGVRRLLPRRGAGS